MADYRNIYIFLFQPSDRWPRVAELSKEVNGKSGLVPGIIKVPKVGRPSKIDVFDDDLTSGAQSSDMAPKYEFTGPPCGSAGAVIVDSRKTYPCRFCPRVFQTASGRYKHHAIHTGNYKHVCFLCDKKFMDSSIYNLHLIGHRKHIQKS